MPVYREHDLEQYLVKQVKAVGGTAYKFNSEGNSGVPDRLCLFPGGILCFVELKAPGKHSRKLQLYQQQKIRSLGFPVFADIDSKEKVNAVISWYQTTAYFSTNVSKGE